MYDKVNIGTAKGDQRIVSDGETTDIFTSQNNNDPLRLLSRDLYDFYQRHNIQLTVDTLTKPNKYRFIRLNPRFDLKETLKLLQDELYNHQDSLSIQDQQNNVLIPVPWLEEKWRFYAVSGTFSLASSICYRSGRIYGVDISSGASVAVLLSHFHDKIINMEQVDNKNDCCQTSEDEIRVLDLCCCPGLKLLQIIDFFYQQIQQYDKNKRKQKKKPYVKVMGVDNSKHRMDKCKAIVQKYIINSNASEIVNEHIDADSMNVQLYLEDGTKFGMSRKTSDGDCFVFDSRVACEEILVRGKRKRMNKSAKARQRKRLRQIMSSEWKNLRRSHSEQDDALGSDNDLRLFDYVLVDAECSTDGSFKHVKEKVKERKYIGHGAMTYPQENSRLIDQEKLSNLVALQRKLISSGFRLLKEGGTMVYSTCSLSSDQNENVVQWLLDNYPGANLIPLHFPIIMESKFVLEGSLKGTIRFYPDLSQTQALLLGDGFFVAKIKKQTKPGLITSVHE